MKKAFYKIKSYRNKLIAEIRIFWRKYCSESRLWSRIDDFLKKRDWGIQKIFILLGTFLFSVLIFTLIYFFIVKPEEGDANWWNSSYRYRKQITVEYSGTEKLTEYQVLVETDTASLVSAGKLQNDCDDIRFTDQTGIELDYYLVDGCNTTDTKIWVKASKINPPKINLFMYYGNSGVSAGSDESATFSYSRKKELAYALDAGVDDLQFMSLENNNSISVLSVDLELDQYETYSMSPLPDGIDNFTPIYATKPFNADDSSNNTDSIVPVSWAGTEFYFYSRDSGENLYLDMVAPWQNASVDVYANGSAVSGCTGLSVTDSGLSQTCSSVGSGAIRVSSDVPILLFTQPTNNDDQMPVKPATSQDWIGGGISTRVLNGNSTLDWNYIYDTASSNVSPSNITANSFASVTGDSGYGGGALRIWSDNTNYQFGVTQVGDGDGGDGHMFNDITEQSTRFGSANQADYISIASTSPATCSLYEQDGKQIGTSQTATSSNSSVYFAGFSTGSTATVTTGAWYMECDEPVVAHYQKATDSESNLMHYPMMRQFTYPTPEVTNIESEEMTKEPVLHLSFDEGQGSTVYNRASTQPPRDPIAYWKMDEGSGTVVYDETLNNRDGGLTGTVGATGKNGRGINFDGTDDCLVIDDTAYNDNTYNPSGSFSISLWMKTDFTSSVDNDNLIFTNREYGSGSNDYLFLGRYWGDGNDMRVYLRDSAGTVQFSEYANDVADQNWHHVVFVIDRENNKGVIYKDGVKEVEADIGTSFNYNSNNWMGVGCEYYTSRRFFYDGSVDEVKIYDYALSAEHVSHEYSHTNGMMMNMSEDDWVQGVNGTALDFDGSSDYVDFGMYSDYAATTDGITYSAWIHPTAYPASYGMIMSKNLPYLSLRNTGGVTFSVRILGTQRSLTTSGGLIPLNEWSHVSGNIDSSGYLRIYINGQLVSTSPQYTGTIDDVTTQALSVARHGSSNSYYFTGLIDEAKVYPYARSSSEIKTDFNAYKNKVGTSVGHGGRQPSQSSTEKPVLWYDFNDGTGTSVYDRSGNGNHGLMTNMDDKTDYVSGKYGKALDFDGNNDYVKSGNNSSLQITGSITIGTWIKTTQSEDGAIFTKWDDNSVNQRAILFAVDNAGKLRLSLDSTGNWTTTGTVYSNTVINDGQWHHVVAVYNGSNISLFVNGILDNSGSYSSGIYNTPAEAEVASMGGGVEWYFDGEIDDLKVYNYARTPAQIHEDMNGSPINYWSFDEGYGTTANDSMGNNDGTITGLSWEDSGRYGKALSYPGSSGTGVDLMDHSDLTNIQSNSHSSSISVWFKSDKTSGGDTVARIITRDASDYFALVADQAGTNSNRLLFYYSDTENSGWQSIDSPTEWHHSVGVWDKENNNFYWYLDGELIYEDTTLTSFSTATRDIFLGANSEGGGLGGNNFSGYIDEAKIYNYALSADQVKSEYNAPYGSPSFDGTSVRYGVGDTDELGFTMPEPLAHWNFDDGSGTSAQDVSENGNTGTLTNMDASTDWVPGKYGKALDFDGSDDWVDVGNIGDPNEGTISLWVNIDNINSGSQYLLDGRSTGNWWFLQDYTSGSCTDSNGNICFNSLVEIPSTELTSGNWHHVVVTLGTSESKIYLDGKLINTGSAFDPSFASVRFATRYTNASYFSGKIDEVKIYDQALTPAQVAWDYNKGKPIFHMKMDQDEFFDCNGGESGSANVCESNSGLHGTANGGMTDSDFVDGKFGNAVELDGSGTVDGVTQGNNVVIPESITRTDNYPGGCTYSVWLKVDTDAVDRMSLFRGAATIRHIEIYSNSKYFRTEAALQNGYSFGTGNFPDDVRGTWSHFVIVFANDEPGRPVRWYQNGKLFHTGNLSSGSYPDTEYFSFSSIGRSTGSTSYTYAKSFDGQIDDVRIYGYPLTEEQIKQDYNNGAAVRFE